MNNNYKIPMNKFSRDVDILNNNNFASEILEDRTMFSKSSNQNDDIDFSTMKPNEYESGMRIGNYSIMNNKKNLINEPYIHESNDKNFQPISSGNYTTIDDKLIDNTSTIKSDIICKIEKTISLYEYDNFSKSGFTLSIMSPFLLSYVWKTIILLSKNPSTNKIIEFLNTKTKNEVTNNMKYSSEIIENLAKITISINTNNNFINTNITNKIENSYNVKFIQSNSEDVVINTKLSFDLNIPHYYSPEIISDSFIGYNNSLVKFIKLYNVPCNLSKNGHIFNIEIPIGDNMFLCFIYTTNMQNIDKLPYEFILKDKFINYKINKLIIPKINMNKKINYGKKFKNELSSVHLGEISYGKMYDISIINEYSLNIATDNNIPMPKYKVSNQLDEITINHKCFYYIKNKLLPNKLLLCGKIEY
jgi:hypothetical protein